MEPIEVKNGTNDPSKTRYQLQRPVGYEDMDKLVKYHMVNPYEEEFKSLQKKYLYKQPLAEEDVKVSRLIHIS